MRGRQEVDGMTPIGITGAGLRRLMQNSCSGGRERSRCAIDILPNAVDVPSTAIEGDRSDIEYIRNVADVTSSPRPRRQPHRERVG
jgi:hypothetical protein